MILPPFRYLRPTSPSGAVALLSQIEGSVVLAGGQTLVNALKLDLVSPSALVDIHQLEELRGVRREGDKVWIGAATTYNEVKTDPDLAEVVPAVPEMAAGLVDRQVRNRGTIGGNCCLNDPTNNFPPLLSALGATFDVLTPEGRQSLSAAEFFLGTLYTAVTRGGLLTGIRLSKLPESSIVVHRHQQIAKDSWALARTVVRLELDGAAVSNARIFLGAVPGSPLQLSRTERALVGQTLDAGLVDTAFAAFDTEPFNTVSDAHGSGGYRRAMARVQLKRALLDAIKERSA